MDIYKKAAQQGLRFSTSIGPLSVEQLYGMKQTQLEQAIRNQKKLLKKTDDDELGFLDTTSKVDETEQLRFDILKDVYLTKKAETEALRTEKEAKDRKNKILELIAEKKEGELKDKSIAELEAML